MNETKLKNVAACMVGAENACNKSSKKGEEKMATLQFQVGPQLQ